MIELAKDAVHDVGFYSIGMDVDDIDKAIEEITNKGGKITMGPVWRSRSVNLLSRKIRTALGIALIEHN